MDEKGKQEMVMIVKKEKEVNFSEVVEDYGAGGGRESYKKKRLALTSHDGGGGGGGGEGGIRCCQVEKCEVDLREAKAYHKRHKVCESHAKAQFVIVAGVRQRFCQQCSRFHELSEFDDSKRSCRRRLAGHNERRRKNSSEPHTQGSTRKGTSTQLKDIPCGKVDDLERGRIGIPIQESSTYKHFQIR